MNQKIVVLELTQEETDLLHGVLTMPQLTIPAAISESFLSVRRKLEAHATAAPANGRAAPARVM